MHSAFPANELRTCFITSLYLRPAGDDWGVVTDWSTYQTGLELTRDTLHTSSHVLRCHNLLQSHPFVTSLSLKTTCRGALLHTGVSQCPAVSDLRLSINWARVLPLTPHSQLSVIQLSSRAGLSPTVPPLPLSVTLTICGGAITDQISIQPPAGDHAPGAPSVWPLSPLLSLSMCCSQWWRDGHQVQTWPALTHMYCTPPHYHTSLPLLGDVRQNTLLPSATAPHTESQYLQWHVEVMAPWPETNFGGLDLVKSVSPLSQITFLQQFLPKCNLFVELSNTRRHTIMTWSHLMTFSCVATDDGIWD